MKSFIVKESYINVFVSFSFKGFLQNDSDSKTEHQKKITDFQLIPYYGTFCLAKHIKLTKGKLINLLACNMRQDLLGHLDLLKYFTVHIVLANFLLFKTQCYTEFIRLLSE